jgi:phosphonate transport system substrate-binding protein
MNRHHFLKSVAGLVTAVGLFGPVTAVARDVAFGIISTESAQNLRAAWAPVLEDMQKRTGLKVEAFFAPDYAGIIEAMRFNKVQVAWYGNKSAMEAVDRSNGEVFLSTVGKDGAEGYYSHLVTHKDSPLKSLDDVVRNSKSLTLGNGDPNSTSGFLVPGYYAFAKNKIDPKRDFKLSRSANHEANLLAAANKQVDVATNNNESMDRLKLTNPAKYDEVKVIWTSPMIPADPLVWRKDLDVETKKKVRDFFLAYGKQGAEVAREKDVLKTLGMSGFKPANDSHLVPIRQLSLFADRLKVENDTQMSDSDRAAKLAEFDRKLADLATQGR